MQTCLIAIGTHVPFGITPCYLPTGSNDIPIFTPIKAGTCKAKLTYFQSWFLWPCLLELLNLGWSATYHRCRHHCISLAITLKHDVRHTIWKHIIYVFLIIEGPSHNHREQAQFGYMVFEICKWEDKCTDIPTS